MPSFSGLPSTRCIASTFEASDQICRQSLFVAQAAGIHMDFWSQQLPMMLTLMLTSKGVAAVPRAALVILSGALTGFNLPIEGRLETYPTDFVRSF